MDQQQIDEINDNDESFNECKCGCKNVLYSYSEIKDNNGYIIDHE